MRKLVTPILSVALAGLLTGCLLSKTQTVTGSAATGFTTNTVTTVNEGNLAIYTTTIRGATALSARIVLTHNKALAQPLQDAQTALTGIINGSNPQTVSQVLEMLKAQNDPILTREATDLVTLASQLEQKLLSQFGQSAVGEITLKLAQAASDGLSLGLATN